MADIFNNQRRLGIKLVADGTAMFNQQPVIGVVETSATFADNMQAVGVDEVADGTVIYNDQPVLGAVLVSDGRALYNNQPVIPVTGTEVVGVYLPTVGAEPLAVYGAKRLVSGYAGDLFTLRRSSDSATQAFAAKLGSDRPDYAAIASWGGASTLFVTSLSDQTGGGKHAVQATAANQPLFDLAIALAGASPIVFDGDNAPVSVRKSMEATGFSQNRQNITMLAAIAPQTSVHTNGICEFTDDALTTSLSLYGHTTSGTSGLTISDGTTNLRPGALFARAQPSVVGLTSDAANTRLFARETNATAAALTSATLTKIALGTHFSNVVYNGCFDLWGFAAYPALSVADAQAVRDVLTSSFSIPTTFTSRIVFDGDSITAGSFTGNRNLTHYLRPLLDGTPEIFNLGVGGRTLAQLDGVSSKARVTSLFTSAYGAGKCLCVMGSGGTNDIFVSGTTAAALYPILTSYVATIRAAGLVLGGVTLLPRTDAGATAPRLAERAAYNPMVVANAAGADFIVDAAADPVMGALTAPDSTTYYRTDKLHPNANGYSYEAANMFAAAINARI